MKKSAAAAKVAAFSLLGAVLWAAPAATWADDELSEEDHDALIYHLNIIANDPGWPQESVDAANAILASLQYTPLAWETFFTEYFTDYPFTDRLYNYLQYPVFSWFDDVVHVKLQMGLDGPLMLVNVDPDWETAIAGPGTSFADDPLLKQDLYNSQNMLTRIGMNDLLPEQTRQAIFDHYDTLIDQHPAVLRKSVTLHRSNQPYFGMFRMQSYMTLVAAAPALDQTTKAQIAATLDLTGVFASLWNDFTCLLLENNLSDDQQRQFVYDYLSLIPSGLHNTVSITINDYLGNGPPFQDQTYSPRRPYGGVNIAGLPIGWFSENSFPPDVPPGRVDVYSIIVAHEINHVVNHYYVEGDSVLGARQSALISAAGCPHLNYLRSMFPDCFFLNAPQEFFASISNQWFTKSAKTIELGLVRFDAGWLEPINQALFFAEVYSQGGNSTLFYRINLAGDITRQTILLERDANGHINELAFDGLRYTFELDAEGNVTGYTVAPACPGDLDGDGDVDLVDLAQVLSNYGTTSGGTYQQGDLDGDGDIDLSDLAALLSRYGTLCE
ncbi:MAG: hypothetical protein ACE5I3_00090 [Phycisphaerae bacterium]